MPLARMFHAQHEAAINSRRLCVYALFAKIFSSIYMLLALMLFLVMLEKADYA